MYKTYLNIVDILTNDEYLDRFNSLKEYWKLNWWKNNELSFFKEAVFDFWKLATVWDNKDVKIFLWVIDDWIDYWYILLNEKGSIEYWNVQEWLNIINNNFLDNMDLYINFYWKLSEEMFNPIYKKYFNKKQSSWWEKLELVYKEVDWLYQNLSNYILDQFHCQLDFWNFTEFYFQLNKFNKFQKRKCLTYLNEMLSENFKIDE